MRSLYTLLLGIAIIVLIYFGLPEPTQGLVLAILAGWTIGGMSRFIVDSLMGEKQ